MRILALVLGSTLCWMHASPVAADSPSAPPAYATSPTVHEPPRAADDSSLYARQRERLRQAGWLRQETTRRLRNEARSEADENLHAISDLIDLYITLRLDDALTDAGRERLAGKVRARLLRIQDRLQKVHADAVGQPGVAANRAPADTPASDQLARHAARRTAVTTAQLAHHVLAQQGLAGPAGAAAVGALGAQPLPPDYGQELADLIQTVIAPTTWERNGGPGSIYYYRPLRVLVIRQTGEAHGQIGDVIEDLRQAGN